MRSSLRYSVFRSMPRILAARLLLPPVAASTRRICSASVSASVSLAESRGSVTSIAWRTASSSIRPCGARIVKPLHHVLQLPDIARPAIVLQHSQAATQSAWRLWP